MASWLPVNVTSRLFRLLLTASARTAAFRSGQGTSIDRTAMSMTFLTMAGVGSGYGKRKIWKV